MEPTPSGTVHVPAPTVVSRTTLLTCWVPATPRVRLVSDTRTSRLSLFRTVTSTSWVSLTPPPDAVNVIVADLFPMTLSSTPLTTKF